MRTLPSLALALLTLAACSHGPPPQPAAAPASAPARPSTDKRAVGLREQQRWIDALPACRAADVAAASASAPELGATPDDQVRVRGHLAIAGEKCTQMACRQCERVGCDPGPGCATPGARLVCGPPLECCNRCDWEWAVAPVNATALRVLRVQRAAADGPLHGGSLDCVMRHLPAPEVVVSGRLSDGDLVTNAELCVVRAP